MPASGITCPQIYYVTPTEVNGIAVDYRSVLRQGEICTGTPTITVTGMTTSVPLVATAAQLINGESVEAGKAITFNLTGGTDGSSYAIKTACGTSASRTREVYVIVYVRVPTVANP